MKVIYTDRHLEHAPSIAGAVGPHPESPQRAKAILEAIQAEGMAVARPRGITKKQLLAVHDGDYLHYLQGAYKAWTEAHLPGPAVIPQSPPHRMDVAPTNIVAQAGHYCFDTETPLGPGTYKAALAAAACALTAAQQITGGERFVFALCRPPGHHAGRGVCGGFCYLNNAAIAAAELGKSGGKVAVLDVDFHHGNGTQEIFYDSPQVFYASLHADPNVAFPHFAGYANERGRGGGAGFNLNIPLPLGTDGREYLRALEQALEAIASFGPQFLVVSLGCDTLAEDPIGGFTLEVADFAAIGRRIGQLGRPCAIVQEGGYYLPSLGQCVVNFLAGMEGRM